MALKPRIYDDDYPICSEVAELAHRTARIQSLAAATEDDNHEEIEKELREELRLRRIMNPSLFGDHYIVAARNQDSLISTALATQGGTIATLMFKLARQIDSLETRKNLRYEDVICSAECRAYHGSVLTYHQKVNLVTEACFLGQQLAMLFIAVRMGSEISTPVVYKLVLCMSFMACVLSAAARYCLR